ncbi:MAG: hypothetical protein SV377_07455 [Halobacteria archaeon]|nr:hypothetical protein [Halobacteria archaeon]
MKDSSIEDLLDEVKTLFDERPETVETGLEVDSASLLQLRKACRLLTAANHLRQENGYYTVVIEVSFAAIERTFQFYLLEKGLLHPDEYIGHQMIYEQGHRAGLYNEEFKEKLFDVWQDNRSHSYYRGGVGSEGRAEKMLELAEAIHNHVLQLAGQSHECICNSTSN